MNSEDLLSAFEEWLQTQRLAAGIGTVPEVLSEIREFAKVIDPVPLDEATTGKMTAFQRSYKDARSDALVAPMAKVDKAIADFRYHQIKYAMLLFRNFRNSVLKNQSTEKAQ